MRAIAGNSCAWRVRDGWQPKNRTFRRFALKTGEALVTAGLAIVETGQGSPRLVLTAKGELLAGDLRGNTSRQRNRQTGR